MTKTLLVIGMVAAILVPVGLAADPAPSDFGNAAKYCKAVRASRSIEAFQTQYGTNKNKKNAFGKCVSATAKAKATKRADAKKDDDNDATEVSAAAACKKKQSEDAAKFALDYKNFGQCVQAGKAHS